MVADGDGVGGDLTGLEDLSGLASAVEDLTGFENLSGSSVWRGLGASVRGPQHERSGLPNQDAWWGRDHAAALIPGIAVLAVADGHGSARSFRSDEGARKAVLHAVRILNELARSGVTPDTPLSAVKRAAAEQVPPFLVRRWRDSVARHLRLHPFSEAERAMLGRQPVELAYGSTLLTVLVTERFIAYWQLGDGELAAAWRDGRVERPLPVDARLFANETTSLCQDDPVRDFRIHVQPLEGGRAARAHSGLHRRLQQLLRRERGARPGGAGYSGDSGRGGGGVGGRAVAGLALSEQCRGERGRCDAGTDLAGAIKNPGLASREHSLFVLVAEAA